MDDEVIDFPVAPKKPYVRPQLHDLTGSRADGKVTPITFEFDSAAGPS